VLSQEVANLGKVEDFLELIVTFITLSALNTLKVRSRSFFNKLKNEAIWQYDGMLKEKLNCI